jgi:hypothetical protein
LGQQGERTTLAAAPAPQTVTAPSIKDQAGKVLAHVAGYVGGRTIEIGLAHGLIEALAERPYGVTGGMGTGTWVRSSSPRSTRSRRQK